MKGKVTIDDLPFEVRQRLRKQMDSDNPKPAKRGKREVNPGHWQDKEKGLQQQVNKMLDAIGFAPRSKQAIESTQGRGGRAGWRLHVARAQGNPLVLDVILFHRNGKDFLEFELKTATGALSPLQKLIIGDNTKLVCRSVEEAEELVRDWLEELET
jgi:hypothetical protein